MNPLMLLALLLFLTHPLLAGAQDPAGDAQLVGRGSLGVRGCADRDPNFAAAVTLAADGTWTASDARGDLFGGTRVPLGTNGRALDLFFDAATEADLIATVAEDVGVLCDRPGAVTVTSSQRKRFALKLNRRRDKAKLVLLYVFRGYAGNRAGSARYRIRARGPFVAAS